MSSKNIGLEPNIFMQADEYLPKYEAFHKFTNLRSLIYTCLRECISQGLEKLQLFEDKQKSTFKILSIGSGDGVVDREILKIVQEEYLNADHLLQDVEILNTAVEPHPIYIKQYRQAIENPELGKGDRLSVKFDFKPVTIEEYIQSEHDKSQYDVVHAIHSLYYVDNPGAILNHCYYNELGDRGLIVTCLIDENNISSKIVSLLNQNRPEDKEKSFYQSESVASIATKNGWQFQRVSVPYFIDVTEIFDQTLDGNRLFEFLVHEENFEKTAPKEEVAKVYALLKDSSVKNDKERWVVKSSNEMILIYKL